MSTQRRIVAALSIAAVIITGALAYGVRHGFTSTFIALPDESVQMVLVPIRSTAVPSADSTCCKNAEHP